MKNVVLTVCDGVNELELPITNLNQLEGEYLPKLIPFFSDSKSQQFDLYIVIDLSVALHITIWKYVPLEQLLKLAAALYAEHSQPQNG